MLCPEWLIEEWETDQHHSVLGLSCWMWVVWYSRDSKLLRRWLSTRAHRQEKEEEKDNTRENFSQTPMHIERSFPAANNMDYVGKHFICWYNLTIIRCFDQWTMPIISSRTFPCTEWSTWRVWKKTSHSSHKGSPSSKHLSYWRQQAPRFTSYEKSCKQKTLEKVKCQTWDWRWPPNMCWIRVVSWVLGSKAFSPPCSSRQTDCIVSIANLQAHHTPHYP